MKRLGLVTLAFTLWCTISAHAQLMGSTSTSTPGGGSIVVVGFNTAVLGTAEAQKNFGALEKKYAPQQQRLQALSDTIETSRKALSDPGNHLSETEKAQRVQDLETKEKQLQRESEDFKNDAQAESQEAFQQVARKFYAFLQEYSQQHGYAIVLDRGTDANPNVWYTAKDVDITEQLVKVYDAKSGVADLPDMPKRASHATNPKQP